MTRTRKTIYTLNVDNYAPGITALTYPLLGRYADKIEAEVCFITQRRWPDYAPVYEKLQIYDLARARDDDWSIYFDGDALIHPDLFDLTDYLPRDTVCHNGADIAGNRWRYDDYFRRDGRHIGSCNWFAAASAWCRDLWAQPDISYAECLANIFPIQDELNSGVIQRDHLIDDYILSRNIARFGLKFKALMHLQAELGDKGNYFLHEYTLTTREKIRSMEDVLGKWGLPVPSPDVRAALAIDGYMRPDELQWLARRAREYERIIEIGSYLGRSTRALADHACGRVTTIDDWFGPRDIDLSSDERQTIAQRFTANLQDHIAARKVFPVTADHRDMQALSLPYWPDMVWIDGHHSSEAVQHDVGWALQRLQLGGGGLLCGHDAERPNVIDSVRSIIPNVRVSLGTIWWAEIVMAHGQQ